MSENNNLINLTEAKTILGVTKTTLWHYRKWKLHDITIAGKIFLDKKEVEDIKKNMP